MAEFETVHLTCTTTSNPPPNLAIAFINESGIVEELAKSQLASLSYSTVLVITSRLHGKALFCIATALNSSLQSENNITFDVQCKLIYLFINMIVQINLLVGNYIKVFSSMPASASYCACMIPNLVQK